MVNHISHLDPLTMAHFVYDHGRVPRYLAKSEPVHEQGCSAASSRSAGQIPVERLSRNAVGAYDAAVDAVNDGECVVIYPEGTLTRDPELWPMTGKSGAARIALATGCPVIPVGQWGAQDILPPYSKKPDVFPRKHLTMKAGDPVVLDDLLALPVTPEVVDQDHRADHGGHHRDRGRAAGRARPDRTLRPERFGQAADRQPQRHERTGRKR